MSENEPIDDEAVHPDPKIAREVRALAEKRSRESTARKLGISLAVLKAHYDADYQTGQDEAEEEVMAKLLAQGKAGNANASWKWMARKGLTAPAQSDNPGGDKRNLGTIDLSRLNDRQLEEYGRLAAIAEGIDPDAIIIEPKL